MTILARECRWLKLLPFLANLPVSENGFISHGRRGYAGSPSRTTGTSVSPMRLVGTALTSWLELGHRGPYLANRRQRSAPGIRGHTPLWPRLNSTPSDYDSRCGEVVAQ